MKGFLGRFHPTVWLVTVAGFLNAAAFSLSLPFLSLYLYQDRGITMTVVGIVILVSGLCSAVAQLFGGALSDRVGRRPLLVIMTLASGLLYFGMAALIQVGASLLALAAMYTGVRVALMVTRPAMAAIVVDSTPRERLTEAYGLLRVGQNLGWAAGPALGGYLAGMLPYSLLFGVGGAIGIIGFLFVFMFLKESLSSTQVRVTARSIFSAGRDKRFLEFTILSLCLFVVMGQLISTLSVFTVDHAGFSTEQYGLLLTLNGVVVVLLQYPVGRAIPKVSKSTVLVVGCLLYALGYLAMGWVGSFSLALFAMFVITLGEITFSPTSSAVVAELSPQEERGRYMGFYGLSETLGLSLGPLLGGVLLDVFSQTPLFTWGMISLVALIAAIGLWRWGRKTRSS